MSKFEIITAATPDRKETVAEIFYQNILWAEISEEIIGNYVIEFYNHPQKKYWEFTFDEALIALEQGKQALIDLGPRTDLPDQFE